MLWTGNPVSKLQAVALSYFSDVAVKCTSGKPNTLPKVWLLPLQQRGRLRWDERHFPKIISVNGTDQCRSRCFSARGMTTP